MADEKGPERPKSHRSTGIVQALDHKASAFHAKFGGKFKKKDKKAAPAGGVDKTPIPSTGPGYTIKMKFHSASNLPFADISSLSSDPYIVAQLKTQLPTRHKQDGPLRWRTPTIRKTLEPEWEDEWIVANVPGSGFEIKARIYDEDPANHDDRMGNVHINCGSISDGWSGIDHESFKIKKRMGSKRAYLLRGCAALFQRETKMTGTLVVSVEILGKTENQSEGRMWTVGPCVWSKHQSPMIGRLAGTKGQDQEGKAEEYDFQANQMQLAGPVPPELYHRYVEFKPFVAGMFNATSIRGKMLHSALHHQHARIYNYDRSTVYGSFAAPSREMVQKFLELVDWDKGGRIFTYILTLDGKWRFTETGKEFGIDLLSKHTMHSDVSVYIAFSGEFFIRRLRAPYKGGGSDDQEKDVPLKVDSKPSEEDPPDDPALYNLVIDNDSGTYRPCADYLPQLKSYMKRNLPGMKITTLDCTGDKEKMEKLKDQQRDKKKSESGRRIVVQGDSSSISSSEISDLDAQGRLAAGP